MNENLFLKQNESSEGAEGYEREKSRFLGDYFFVLETQAAQENEGEKRRYINKEKKVIEGEKDGINTEVLKSPEGLNRFFKNAGFKTIDPVSVVKKEGTTLYVSSGVQILDQMIHMESEIPEGKMFVAQPVIRTQFIDSVKDNTSTSFINLSTESVNNGVVDHFDIIRKWFDFLASIGILPNEISIVERSTNQRWGKRKFNNFVLKFFCNNLEIGDAVYIPLMPQDSRLPISISDVGFGAERLTAVSKHGLYFSEIVQNNPELVGIDEKILDYIRTVTLIASSGINPSNNDHGYRFRLFIKRLVPEILGSEIDVRELIGFFFDEWKKWGSLPIDKDTATATIIREIERALNRLILDEVNRTYKLPGVEINRPVKDFLIALKNSGVKHAEMQSLVKRYNIKL